MINSPGMVFCWAAAENPTKQQRDTKILLNIKFGWLRLAIYVSNLTLPNNKASPMFGKALENYKFR
jgi:hypothetical protein